MNNPTAKGWKLQAHKLHREFRFKDFRETMNFLNQVAEVAEALDHHPDFSVHYNVVQMTLWTHTTGGVTNKDYELAEKINALY